MSASSAMAGRTWQPSDTRARRSTIGILLGATVLLIGAASVMFHAKAYQSAATMVFLEATSIQQLELELGHDVPGEGQSPMARDSTTVVGDAFARIYRSSAKLRQLASEGLEGRLAVSNLSGINGLIPVYGPVLSIVVVASSPARAVDGAALVVNDVANELEARQSGYDPRLSVHATVTTEPTAVLTSGSRVRSAVAFTALAVLVALVTPHVLGRFGRASRRSETSALPAVLPRS